MADRTLNGQGSMSSGRKKVEKKHPTVINSWEKNWENKKFIYATNMIEGLNRQLRKGDFKIFCVWM